MTTVPPQYQDAIDWVSQRITEWSANPEAIGLDEPTTTAIATQVAMAEGAQSAAFSARQASKDATGVYYDQGDQLLDLARQAVATIRAFAKSSEDPQTVYSAASIPAPATPGPTPAPGRPFDFRTELLFGGQLRITFDCDNPSRVQGVTYKVERQDQPQGAFAFLTNAKSREFTDETIPSGTSQVTYRVTAQTSTKDGLANGFTVRFGANNQAVVSGEDGGEELAA
ncbi:MAG: hypothetical protein AAFV77_10045 [Planctomycetota bacterium]